MNQETVLLVIAGAVGAGLLLLAISVFSVSKALRRIYSAIEETRSVHQTTLGDILKISGERLGIERKKLDLETMEKKSHVVLIKSTNLKLFEERQELSVGYSVENLGHGRILATKLQIALVNRRTPNLIKIIDVIFNKVVSPDRPLTDEIIISVNDLTKVSLPFVPDFGYIKDSCQIVASLEYEDHHGERYRIDKDILEW